MRGSKKLFVIALAIALFIPGISQGQVADAAPKTDRDLIAEILRKCLAKEMIRTELKGQSEQRHKEEIDLPFGIAKVVTYWKSKASGEARFTDPETNLVVEVPKMIRESKRTTIVATASIPMNGKICGSVTTDDNHELLTISSNFDSKLAIRAEFTIARDSKDGRIDYRVEITNWTLSIRDTHFDNQVLNDVRGVVEDVANEKLKIDVDKFRSVANDALKNAYQDGKLKLDVPTN